MPDTVIITLLINMAASENRVTEWLIMDVAVIYWTCKRMNRFVVIVMFQNSNYLGFRYYCVIEWPSNAVLPVVLFHKFYFKTAVTASRLLFQSFCSWIESISKFRKPSFALLVLFFFCLCFLIVRQCLLKFSMKLQ